MWKKHDFLILENNPNSFTDIKKILVNDINFINIKFAVLEIISLYFF